MVKSRKKLDFWFWVKVLVVGFMLIFLFYPFCTLITRSFFQKMRLVLPWRTMSGSLQKNTITMPWGEVCSCPWSPHSQP